MAVSAKAVPEFRFRLNLTSGLKPLLHLPHTIRLPKRLQYSQKWNNKTRANMSEVPTTTKPERNIIHGRLKNFEHSLWGETFAFLAPHDSELESHSKEVEAMKIKVKNMLLDSTKKLTDNIEFINLLCRLGVAYHFEDEINEQLNHIFTMLPKLLEDNDYELCTLANLFRVLRQYGYKMTSDVFKKFKDTNGEFKEEITNDVNGILCLYEACFLAIHGEDILDDALAFTRKHLEILAKRSSPHLQRYISNSLMHPSHHCIERIDAFNSISFYEEDKSVDGTLLKFAKLDFNGLQLLYKKELALLSRWWADLNVAENFPFSRDRLVESYMWALGTIFEPQYSISRMNICKYIAMLTPLDDAYDSYGTIDEIQLMTAALQRFTVDAGDELPEYMKVLYKFIFETFEIDDTQECSEKATFAKEMMKEMVAVLNEEAIWLRERKAPSFDEYTIKGKLSNGFKFFTSGLILGADNMGMNEILWLLNDPPIVDGAKLHARFLNDISGVRKNSTRGEFPKAVDCYMIQYGVSQDEAIEAIQEILENKWKLMNEDLLKPANVQRILLKQTYNYARTTHIFYTDTDLFTNYGNILQPIVASLIIDPLPM